MGKRIICYLSCILSTYYEIAGHVGVRIRKEDEDSMNQRRGYGTKTFNNK